MTDRRYRRVILALGLGLGAAVGCSGDDLAAGTCRSQRDCAANEVCIAGACTPANTPDDPCTAGSCPSGEFCDLTDLRCKPIDGVGLDAGLSSDGGPGSNEDAGPVGPCNDDTDCGTPPVDICIANQCVKGCGQPGGLVCTGGTTCDMATGKCMGDESCNEDVDCGPPQRICEDNMCIAGCVADSSLCEMGVEVCDTNTGRCVRLPNRCGDDSQCNPPSTVCENMQCVPGCGQPGGVQCSGMTPRCIEATGRCGPPRMCMVDADCMNPDEICLDQACTLRCDRGGSCPIPNICDTSTGICLPGQVALGDPCQLDAQCQGSVCLTVNVNMTTQQICATPCGSTSECPLDFTCGELSEMKFCLSERLTTPVLAFDTRSGGFCSQANNTCQSRWCDLNASTCLEVCSRNSDCTNFGGQCWMFQYDQSGQNEYETFCEVETGGVGGAPCTANDQCQSNLCSTGTNACAAFCCRDQDCGASENCVLYNLDPANLVKVCEPRSTTAGTQALGTSCTANTQCETEICIAEDPSAPNGARQCSTRCCRHSDCSFLGATARCRPTAGPIANSLTGLCFDR